MPHNLTLPLADAGSLHHLQSLQAARRVDQGQGAISGKAGDIAGMVDGERIANKRPWPTPCAAFPVTPWS